MIQLRILTKHIYKRSAPDQYGNESVAYFIPNLQCIDVNNVRTRPVLIKDDSGHKIAVLFESTTGMVDFLNNYFNDEYLALYRKITGKGYTYLPDYSEYGDIHVYTTFSDTDNNKPIVDQVESMYRLCESLIDGAIREIDYMSYNVIDNVLDIYTLGDFTNKHVGIGLYDAFGESTYEE